MPQATLCVVALFMANDNQSTLSQSSKTADNGLIVTKVPVTAQRNELVKQASGKILEMRPFRMTGDLRFLPWGQFRICIAQHFGGFGLQFVNFRLDIKRAFIRSISKFQNTGFESRDWFFKIEIRCHENELEPDKLKVNARDLLGSKDDVYSPAQPGGHCRCAYIFVSC